MDDIREAYCGECGKLRFFRYLDCEDCKNKRQECIWVCTACGVELDNEDMDV